MKRIISLTILIVFLLSLFVMPAEAAFLDEQINMSLGFEENIEGVTGVTNTVTYVTDGANGTKGALKIHETADGGDIKINIPNIENLRNKKIKISFLAKWDAVANEGIVLKRMSPGAVMWFPHSGGTAYVFGSGTSPNVTTFMQGDWTRFEITIPAWGNLKNPDGSWTGKDGATGRETDRFDYDYVKSRGIYIYPRLFYYSDGKFSQALRASNSEAAQSFPSGGVIWYMDDFKFEVEDPNIATKDVPEVSNLTVDNDHFVGAATISYDYAPSTNAAESKSVVTISKQLADGKTAILKQGICNTATSTNQETGKVEYRFNITEDMLGEKLTFSVQPFDKTATGEYIQGTTVTYAAVTAVAPKYIITPGAFTFGDGSITASIAVTNNSAETLNVFMIVALYDAEGRLVGYDNTLNTKHLPVAASTTVNTSNSLTVAVPSNVTSAKAFFWTGTSIDDVVAQGITNSLSATR